MVPYPAVREGSDYERAATPPDDARAWLNRARMTPNYREELCLNAHQVAEKAMQGLFVKAGAQFPSMHDLNKLLKLLESARERRRNWGPVAAAGGLSRYIFDTRYPDVGPAVTEAEYR